MKALFTMFRRASSLVFPFYCVLCGLRLEADLAWPLCLECAAGLPAIRGRTCRTCGRPLLSSEETCLSCRSKVNPCAQVRALYHYNGQARQLVTQYKQRQRRSLARFIAADFAKVLATVPFDTMIVPVPPRPGKLLKTGWDQVREICHWLRQDHGHSWVSCLRRLPGGKEQKSLSAAARFENMKQRFVMKSGVSLLPRPVILLDDVETTGATLSACASVLLAAGAVRVEALVFAAD